MGPSSAFEDGISHQWFSNIDQILAIHLAENSDLNKMDRNAIFNDFVGVPIIISDYDALISGTSHTNSKDNGDICSAPASPSSPKLAPDQKWTTGFNDFAEDLWARMTITMKKKLRSACVEVLRQTEEPHMERVQWRHDDDARMLD